MALRLGGLSSGLDVDAVVSQLMAVERRPVTQLTRRQNTYQAQLNAWNEIRSKLDALEAKLADLKAASNFTARSATVGDTALFTATADSSAAVSTSQVEVVALATYKMYQATPAATVSDPDAALGTGTLEIVAKDSAGAAVTKTINLDGSKSLNQVAAEINGWTDTELTATVAQVRTGEYELVVQETRTGAAYDFTVTQTAGTVFGAINVNQAAQDAHIKVNNIDYWRAGNTITDVLSGVTLTLKQEGGPTSLDVAKDTKKASDTIQAFVDAYNAFVDTVNKHSRYDADTKTRGPLVADVGVSGLVNRVRSALTRVVGAAAEEVNSLNMIGVKTDYKTGHLEIDQAKLTDQLENYASDVQALFQDASEGLAVATHDLVSTYTGSTGLISGTESSIQKQLDSIGDKIRFLEDVILPKKEARLRQQFTRMEQALSHFQTQGAWLQSQIANMGG